ncbi:MAG: MoaD/ThiS family protein, partial [Alphaproteobacteria bacterium]
MIEVLYFAWLRERIGIPRETIDSQAATVADLIEELRGKDPRYAMAFSDLSA